MTPPDFLFRVEPDFVKTRLDIFLARKLPQFSRSQIQKWVRGGHVLLNGLKTSPADQIPQGATLQVRIPPEELSVMPEKIPIKILHEDGQILVIDKPAGMVTHPAAGNYTGTLANAAAHHLETKRRKNIPKGLRPGIVHRLDKATSGVLVIAKNTRTMAQLSKQFETRSVEKVYRAVVIGKVASKEGEIVGAIGKDFDKHRMRVTPSGRYAKTDFKVLKRFPSHTYVEVYPKTGRTHQIRVHLAKIGHPVLGDPVYSGNSAPPQRMMLHAFRLSIDHPAARKRLTFTAPIPKDFQKVLDQLNQKEYC